MFEEDNSFTTITASNINELSESAEVNSLAPSTSSTVRSNKRSFIWNYCEDLTDGWRCIVPKESGDICGQYFPITATKGSTTNTIYHLLSQHGIVNPKAADKVFMIKF